MKIENLKLKITRRGFTMIELLIVIAVLGILAVAVLSALNPIEQINRSKDTGGRSDAEQLIGGIDRFYTTKGYYPWANNTSDTNLIDWAPVNGYVNLLNNLTNATQELKGSFITRISAADYNHLYIFNNGLQGNSTYVCFKPQSKAFDDDVVKRCGVAGAGMPTDLKANTAVLNLVCGGAGNSYSCLP